MIGFISLSLPPIPVHVIIGGRFFSFLMGLGVWGVKDDSKSEADALSKGAFSFAPIGEIGQLLQLATF